MEAVVQRATHGVVGAADGFPAGVVRDDPFADRSASGRQPAIRGVRSFRPDHGFDPVSGRRVHDGRVSLGHARGHL